MALDVITADFEKPIVRKLREWILSQPQFKNPIVDESFLLRFLRFKKFNLSDAMRVYTQYVKTRDLHPNCYKNLDILDAPLHDLIQRGYVFPLLEKDSLGRSVVFVRNGAFGQRFGHRPTDLYRSLVMTLETLLMDEENQKKGLIYVVDFEGQYLSDIAYVGLVEAQKLARSGEKCYPVTHKEAHWINASRLVRTCFWFLISFIPEHLKKRLRLHKNLASLHACIGSSILPAEYGGTVSWKVMASKWVTRLAANRPYLMAMDQMSYDDTRVPACCGA